MSRRAAAALPGVSKCAVSGTGARHAWTRLQGGDDDPVAATRLGLVEQRIGPGEQRVGVERRSRRSQADARGDAQPGLDVVPRMLAHDLAQSLAGTQRRVGRGVAQDDSELFAAHAHDDVLGPAGAAQDAGQLDENAIANGVRKAIVDVLEVIQVEQRHRHRLALARGQGLRRFLEPAAIAQAGERIGADRSGLVLRLVDERLAPDLVGPGPLPRLLDRLPGPFEALLGLEHTTAPQASATGSGAAATRPDIEPKVCA